MNAKNQRNFCKSGFQKRDERQKPEELRKNGFRKRDERQKLEELLQKRFS